LNKFMLIVH